MPAAEGTRCAFFGKARASSGRMMPTRPPTTIDHTFIGSQDVRPSAIASATAFQVWAAGAGNWSVPSTEASGTSTRKESTVTSVPTKMPANCARNCLRGLAPSR